MPQYRVLKPSFVNNVYHETGAIIDYDGEIADNLEPLNKKSTPPVDDQEESLA